MIIINNYLIYNKNNNIKPKYLSYDVLYSNKMILDKYNKTVPKTWDELIDTCEYIMEKEKNDTELICYNGFFDGIYFFFFFFKKKKKIKINKNYKKKKKNKKKKKKKKNKKKKKKKINI